MSRYWDDDPGEDFQNQSHFFDANAERALKGKRGRKALAELREALMAVPDHRLIAGALCTVNPAGRADEDWARRGISSHGEGVCAIGALLWHRKVKGGMDPEEAFAALPTLDSTDYEIYDTADLARREAGLPFPLAWRLAYRNDETYDGMTPGQRWEAFVGWIDRELAGSQS